MNEIANESMPTTDALARENRALKRKLALAEANLYKMRVISASQERVEMISNDSLKKELQFFKLVLENTNNILLLLDFDGRFAYASRTFLRNAAIANFGLISGRHFQEVLTPLISEASFLKFNEAVNLAVLQKNTVAIEDEIDFNARGLPRTFSILITPMTDADNGKSTGIMALFNDITEMNDAMEAAKRANLAKSDFLANMSHEIRTPLNAIIGMSAIAQGSADLDKARYCLDKIGDSSKHLLGIINDILDMSKIEANHFELSFSEFVFEKMLLRIVDVMRFKMEEKNISFRLYCDPDIPFSILSDEQRLSQVIMNLMSNAVKFTPEYGRITLRAAVECVSGDEYTLRISVQDSGIGISKEQGPRLFKAFSQADNSISRKFGGTGLGLAISKSIVDLLAGEIAFDSVLGKGTTFTFSMKTQACQREPMQKNSGVRILALDAAAEVLSSFLRYADKLGVTCAGVEKTECALEALQNNSYDIVFADWQTLGGEASAALRRFRNIPNPPAVVIMTDTADWSEIEDDAKHAGVRDFMSKPVLLPVIEGVLNKYCAGQQTEEKALPDDFSDKTILLADDIQINREIVLSLLEHTGAEIVCAENGREAVALFSSAPARFDLIFMDVQMPEMDGYEATLQIRAAEHENARKIPIVAMTANVFKEDIERCLNVGMNDHIGKPVDPAEILTKVRNWTDHPMHSQQG